MTIKPHVLTEVATLCGWQTVCSEHSTFCKEDAFDYAYFDGKELVVNVLAETSSESAFYRMVAPTPSKPLRTIDIKVYVEERKLTFIHEIVTNLRKDYSGNWVSEFCSENNIKGYLPYAFYKDGLVVLRLAEYKSPSGEREFILLSQEDA